MEERLAARRLNGRQVRDLLAATAGVTADPEVTQAAGLEAHRMPGDAVLVVLPSGKGWLYESRHELLTSLDEMMRQEIRHPLRDLPEGRTFGQRASGLAAELAAQAPGLDGTEPSLDEVDRLVRRRGAAEFRRPEQLQRLIAYVGEVMRGITGGAWTAVLAFDGETWEPWIVEPDGRQHPVSSLVFKELHEWDRSSSIRGVIAGRLGPRPPRTPRTS
jgi:hypothetical protein